MIINIVIIIIIIIIIVVTIIAIDYKSNSKKYNKTINNY